MKPFEVFKIDAAGECVWVGEAADLEEATSKAKEALAGDPQCDFCMIDQQTGAIENVQLSDVRE
jgi:hypothetical protein